MINRDPSRPRMTGAAARIAAIGCALLVACALQDASPSGRSVAAADVTAGTAQVTTPNSGAPGTSVALTSGGSSTAFTLQLPLGAACKGDSATDGYRVQSYMVPVGVAPSSLAFASTGPTPAGVGAAFRQPLFTAFGSPFVNKQTAAADTQGGPGLVVDIPGFSFGVFGAGDISAATYNIGIACTLGPASATQLEKFWNVQMVVAADPADTPAGIHWTVSQTTATSTTAVTTTTTTGAGASTTTSRATMTTIAGSTSTTSHGPTTTTTAVGSAAGGVTATTTPLPRTGGDSGPLVLWALLLLVFGRMAVLVARSPWWAGGRG